jgi:RNA polymerase sigma-70 factor (ECF subfamily)
MSGDEARLIRRAKEGDPAAFAEIYGQHQLAIYRYVLARVGDVATAEDLTGEVFVRMVESIDQFTYRGRPLLTWLYTIARHLIVDHQRQRGRVTLLPSSEEQLVTDLGDPVRTMERGLTHRRLVAALTHLTDAQRQVITLKFVEGLSNAEVARRLGKTVGAIKSLQHRALAALRRVLEGGES